MIEIDGIPLFRTDLFCFTTCLTVTPMALFARPQLVSSDNPKVAVINPNFTNSVCRVEESPTNLPRIELLPLAYLILPVCLARFSIGLESSTPNQARLLPSMTVTTPLPTPMPSLHAPSNIFLRGSLMELSLMRINCGKRCLRGIAYGGALAIDAMGDFPRFSPS